MSSRNSGGSYGGRRVAEVIRRRDVRRGGVAAVRTAVRRVAVASRPRRQSSRGEAAVLRRRHGSRCAARLAEADVAAGAAAAVDRAAAAVRLVWVTEAGRRQRVARHRAALAVEARRLRLGAAAAVT